MKKFFFDLFPVIAFFVIFRWAQNNLAESGVLVEEWLGWLVSGAAKPEQAPILLATAVVIVATFLQIVWLTLRRQKVEFMLWLSLGLVVVLGGATIWLNDEVFIKWKPTALYLAIAISLAVAQIFFKKNAMQALLGEKLLLPDRVWHRLLWAWVLFFIAKAALNLYVAYNFSTETWVNYKLFGTTALMLAFLVLQGIYIAKYVKQPADAA